MRKELVRKVSGYNNDKFDRIAWFYDLGLAISSFFFGGERRIRERALKHAGLREGERVLDVGCGTGNAAFLIACRVGLNGEVVGIDLSEKMLEKGRRKLAKTGARNVTFFRANAEDLPFPDKSFDKVTFFAVLHEMNHEGRLNTLKKVCRVLKPGGRVLISDLGVPERVMGKLLMKAVLLVEGETAKEMVRRGLDAEVREAAGESLRVVERKSVFFGLGEILLLEKVRAPAKGDSYEENLAGLF